MVLDYFKEFTKIPRCSQNADKFKDYIVDFATKHNYDVEVDSIKNILITKKGSKLTLQAHYDMVCIGDTQNMVLVEKDGFLSAKNSSLGADNAIAIAMMFEMMSKGIEVDFLLTSDEEIGLVGARALELKTKTSYLLNLDSEDENFVTISCAGGCDFIAYSTIQTQIIDGFIYDVEFSGYDGGHSGIDIDKNIPNAIKELSKELQSLDAKIIEINGGERRNSIPVKAKAKVLLKDKTTHKNFKYISKSSSEVFKNSKEILELLNKIKHGVLEKDSDQDILSSANLAKITTTNKEITIELSIRSMKDENLKKEISNYIEFFNFYSFKNKQKDYYSPWEKDKNSFSDLVLEKLQNDVKDASYFSIHAGLECGILKTHLKDVKMASIGPNIFSPHSKSEKVEIKSVYKIYNVVLELIEELNK